MFVQGIGKSNLMKFARAAGLAASVSLLAACGNGPTVTESYQNGGHSYSFTLDKTNASENYQGPGLWCNSSASVHGGSIQTHYADSNGRTFNSSLTGWSLYPWMYTGTFQPCKTFAVLQAYRQAYRPW